jgi:hypothetical protein
MKLSNSNLWMIFKILLKKVSLNSIFYKLAQFLKMNNKFCKQNNILLSLLLVFVLYLSAWLLNKKIFNRKLFKVMKYKSKIRFTLN